MARYPVLETQIVMPCYVICDVSRSMPTMMLKLQQVLEGLTNDANNDPILDDYRRLRIVTFGGAAKMLARLFRPSEAQIPQLTTIGGGTNLGAAFEKYHRALEADMAGLTAEVQTATARAFSSLATVNLRTAITLKSFVRFWPTTQRPRVGTGSFRLYSLSDFGMPRSKPWESCLILISGQRGENAS